MHRFHSKCIYNRKYHKKVLVFHRGEYNNISVLSSLDAARLDCILLVVIRRWDRLVTPHLMPPYKAQCSALIGWFSTATIGTFRCSLSGRVVFSSVRWCVALLMLCFLIVGIQMVTHASRIFIPLSSLMFFGFSWVLCEFPLWPIVSMGQDRCPLHQFIDLILF